MDSLSLLFLLMALPLATAAFEPAIAPIAIAAFEPALALRRQVVVDPVLQAPPDAPAQSGLFRREVRHDVRHSLSASLLPMNPYAGLAGFQSGMQRLQRRPVPQEVEASSQFSNKGIPDDGYYYLVSEVQEGSALEGSNPQSLQHAR